MVNLVEIVKKTACKFSFIQDVVSACDTEYFIPSGVDNRGMIFPEKDTEQDPPLNNYKPQESNYKR